MKIFLKAAVPLSPRSRRDIINKFFNRAPYFYSSRGLIIFRKPECHGFEFHTGSGAIEVEYCDDRENAGLPDIDELGILHSSLFEEAKSLCEKISICTQKSELMNLLNNLWDISVKVYQDLNPEER